MKLPRKIRRNILRNAIKNKRLSKPNKQMKHFWKTFNSNL